MMLTTPGQVRPPVSVAVLLVGLLVGSLGAVTFWGAKQSRPVGTPPADLRPGEWVWNPAAAPAGPITVLVSLSEQRGYVYRNGVEIGRSRIELTDPARPLGSHVFIVKHGPGATRATPRANGSLPAWSAVAMPGYADEAGRELSGEAAARVRVPPAFAKVVYPLLTPGAALFVTDAPVLTQTTGHNLTVLGGGLPE